MGRRRHAKQGEAATWLRDVALKHRGSACLLWPFSVDGGGYGQLVSRGKHLNAHRVLCRMAHGKPPSKKHDAAHSCNVKRCCNKKHLRWATRRQNLADRAAHGTLNRGTRNGSAKLTNRSVRSIRRLIKTKDATSLAARYGVSQTTITRCVNRETWAWLT